MNESVKVIRETLQARSSAYVTMHCMASDDESADYWWNKHLDMEEKLASF
jgi:hypothetical protein